MLPWSRFTSSASAGSHVQEGAITGALAGMDLSGVTAEDERKLVQVQAGIRGYLARKHLKERARRAE